MKSIVDKYNVVIVGGGFAGCSAAIYFGMSRGTKDCVVICGDNPLVNSVKVFNSYVGYNSISAYELTSKMMMHVQLYSEVIYDYVVDIRLENDVKIVETFNAIYKCKSVIIASGTSIGKIPGVNHKLYGKKGDYLLYRDKVAAVIGGGNAAFEAALSLSDTCSQVYLINRTDVFKSFTMLQDQVKAKSNIEIITNEEVESWNDGVLYLKNRVLSEVSGMFVCIGHIPNSDFAGILKRDEHNYIEVDKYFESSVKGVFAVGSVVKNDYNYAIIAAGDGAKAALNVIKYLRMHF